MLRPGVERYPYGLSLRRIVNLDGRPQAVFLTNQKPKQATTYKNPNRWAALFDEKGFTQTRVIAKASHAQTLKEASVFTGAAFGNTERHLRAINMATRYVDKLLDCRGYRRNYLTARHFRPGDEHCVKTPTSSPGEPWCFKGGTYADVVKSLDRDCQALKDEYGEFFEFSSPITDYKIALEDGASYIYIMYVMFRDCVISKKVALNNGDFVDGMYIMSFLVHGKEDKYSANKILAEAFRTIQGTDLFLMYLMYEFCEELKKHMYADRDHWLITADPYELMLARNRLRGMHTTGIDYTAFDRYQSPQLVFAFFKHLTTHGLDENVAHFVATAISYGWLAFHGDDNGIFIHGNRKYGVLIPRMGGNPSGQYWTTLLNCFSHTVYIAYAMSNIDFDEESDYEYFSSVVWMVHGDDEVIGHQSRGKAKEYLAEMLRVQGEIGQIVKPEEYIFDGQVDDVFPPGIVAPFLGTTCQFFQEGIHISVPTQPTRRIPMLLYTATDDEFFPEVVKGVHDNLLALKILSMVRGESPHPISEFVDNMCRQTFFKSGVPVSDTVQSMLEFIKVNCTDSTDADPLRLEKAYGILAGIRRYCKTNLGM